MLTALLSAAGVAVAYRLTMAATKNAPAGSKRARVFVALGGGPGPYRPK